jgi:hypothetical protein
MPALRTLAFAILRFFGALAAGLILLFAVNLIMLFTGVGARWSGFLVLALPLIFLMAVRYAYEGTATAFDRGVGAATAAVSAVAVAGFGVVALLGGGV